jgi:hypothetical protein
LCACCPSICPSLSLFVQPISRVHAVTFSYIEKFWYYFPCVFGISRRYVLSKTHDSTLKVKVILNALLHIRFLKYG